MILSLTPTILLLATCTIAAADEIPREQKQFWRVPGYCKSLPWMMLMTCPSTFSMMSRARRPSIWHGDLRAHSTPLPSPPLLVLRGQGLVLSDTRKMEDAKLNTDELMHNA